MQTNQILSAPLLDIIFDGRNKAYGAYELRKSYEKRIRKAMIITFSLAALAFGSVVMASTFKKKDDQYRLKEEMMLTEIKEIQKPEPLPEQPKPKMLWMQGLMILPKKERLMMELSFPLLHQMVMIKGYLMISLQNRRSQQKQ